MWYFIREHLLDVAELLLMCCFWCHDSSDTSNSSLYFYWKVLPSCFLCYFWCCVTVDDTLLLMSRQISEEKVRGKGQDRGVDRRERMKRGRCMKDRDERSREMEIHMCEVLVKIKEAESSRLPEPTTRRNRNWSDTSVSWLDRADTSRWVWKKRKRMNHHSGNHKIVSSRSNNESQTCLQSLIWITGFWFSKESVMSKKKSKLLLDGTLKIFIMNNR